MADNPFKDADFKGAGYDPERDQKRLAGAVLRVYKTLSEPVGMGFRWMTLRDIAERSRTPEASASAHIRTLRNEFFLQTETDRRSDGVWVYRYKGPMTQEEIAQLRQKRKSKPKRKAVGNASLWNTMFEKIYESAVRQDDDAAKIARDDALAAWADDLEEAIRKKRGDNA